MIEVREKALAFTSVIISFPNHSHLLSERRLIHTSPISEATSLDIQKSQINFHHFLSKIYQSKYIPCLASSSDSKISNS